jgi:hypothetical protein
LVVTQPEERDNMQLNFLQLEISFHQKKKNLVDSVDSFFEIPKDKIKKNKRRIVLSYYIQMCVMAGGGDTGGGL